MYYFLLILFTQKVMATEIDISTKVPIESQNTAPSEKEIFYIWPVYSKETLRHFLEVKLKMDALNSDQTSLNQRDSTAENAIKQIILTNLDTTISFLRRVIEIFDSLIQNSPEKIKENFDYYYDFITLNEILRDRLFLKTLGLDPKVLSEIKNPELKEKTELLKVILEHDKSQVENFITYLTSSRDYYNQKIDPENIKSFYKVFSFSVRPPIVSMYYELAQIHTHMEVANRKKTFFKKPFISKIIEQSCLHTIEANVLNLTNIYCFFNGKIFLNEFVTGFENYSCEIKPSDSKCFRKELERNQSANQQHLNTLHEIHRERKRILIQKRKEFETTLKEMIRSEYKRTFLDVQSDFQNSATENYEILCNFDEIDSEFSLTDSLNHPEMMNEEPLPSDEDTFFESYQPLSLEEIRADELCSPEPEQKKPSARNRKASAAQKKANPNHQSIQRPVNTVHQSRVPVYLTMDALLTLQKVLDTSYRTPVSNQAYKKLIDTFANLNTGTGLLLKEVKNNKGMQNQNEGYSLVFRTNQGKTNHQQEGWLTVHFAHGRDSNHTIPKEYRKEYANPFVQLGITAENVVLVRRSDL